MDKTISNFLQQGSIHSTTKSHRTAAKTFGTFLLNKGLAKGKDSLELSQAQWKDLNDWKPTQPPHLPPTSLAIDIFFARFLIKTMKQIQKDPFGKPTLRARQGWIT